MMGKEVEELTYSGEIQGQKVNRKLNDNLKVFGYEEIFGNNY